MPALRIQAMKLRNIFRALFPGTRSGENQPQRTLPVYFPLVYGWRLLSRAIMRGWKGAIIALALFLAIFAALFYLVNLDLKPSPKISSSSGQSFAGELATGDLKGKMGATDVSDLSYGQWVSAMGLTQNNNKPEDDPDGDGLPNYLEYAYGTNPLKADTDGDGFSDKQEIINGYDPDAPGEAKPTTDISIAKIGIDAPMIWSQSEDEKSLDKDLESGAAHYPKTAAPGQAGNMIVSGHSSNYVWAAGSYNHIFKNLNNLAVGDKIDVKTIQQNGRVITYHYQVTGKKIVGADDQSIFDPTPDATLTLATCWPIGTNLKRLLVSADLVK